MSYRYQVGDELETVAGTKIQVLEVVDDHFLSNDGMWRWDTPHPEAGGRLTGTPCYPPSPLHIAKDHPLNNPREVMSALASMPRFRRVYQGGKSLDSYSTIRWICHALDHLFDHKKETLWPPYN